MSTKRLGFMMRDLLVLIMIIAIGVPLVIVMIPSPQNVRTPAGRTPIINNLKQLTLAMHAYNDIYKRLPPATGTFGDITRGNRSLSIFLLSYIEQNCLYNKIRDGDNVPPVVVPPYTANLDATTADFVGVQNFAANVRVFTDLGVNTAFNADVVGITSSGNEGWNNSKIPGTFKDGTSNTILFATRYANNGAVGANGSVNCSAYDAWIGKDNSAFFGVSTLAAAPTAQSKGGWQLAPTITQADCKFGVAAHSLGTGGIQVGLGDASARTVSPAISTFSWNAAMQPNDGNALGSDW